ncbi:MAG: hypothetical protein WC069_00525 [Candidatus Shapirobacteria bacterium]
MSKTIGQYSKSKSNFDYLAIHLDSLPVELQYRICTKVIKKLSI